MNRSMFSLRNLVILFLLLGVLPVSAKNPDFVPLFPEGAEGLLTVRLVNVGKGDAMILQLPDGKVCLIDTGFKETAADLLEHLRKWNIKTIDLLILTHPDKDHIGGYPYILNECTVKQTVISFDPRDPERKARIKAVRTLLSGPDYQLQLLAPNADFYDKVNDYSLVTRLTFGKFSFLFAGDVEKTSQREILDSGVKLQADVLKVPHHGRLAATSEAFFKAIKPRYAIITCDHKSGEDPDGTILDMLSGLNCQVLRSDQSGTIRFRTDGKILEMKP